MRDLKGFLRKKDLAEFLLQGLFFYCGFTNWVCPKSGESTYFALLIAACAAANRAIGTRKGEQET